MSRALHSTAQLSLLQFCGACKEDANERKITRSTFIGLNIEQETNCESTETAKQDSGCKKIVGREGSKASKHGTGTKNAGHQK